MSASNRIQIIYLKSEKSRGIRVRNIKKIHICRPIKWSGGGGEREKGGMRGEMSPMFDNATERKRRSFLSLLMI